MSNQKITSLRAVMELSEKYPWANREQLEEIAVGQRIGLTGEQITLYARPELHAAQMGSVRYAAQRGLPMQQLRFLSDPAFEPLQMDVLKASFEAGMSMEQIGSFAKPEIPARQMLDAYWAIRAGRVWEEPREAETAQQRGWQALGNCWESHEEMDDDERFRCLVRDFLDHGGDVSLLPDGEEFAPEL